MKFLSRLLLSNEQKTEARKRNALDSTGELQDALLASRCSAGYTASSVTRWTATLKGRAPRLEAAAHTASFPTRDGLRKVLCAGAKVAEADEASQPMCATCL